MRKKSDKQSKQSSKSVSNTPADAAKTASTAAADAPPPKTHQEFVEVGSRMIRNVANLAS